MWQNERGSGWLGPQQRKPCVLPYSPLKSHSRREHGRHKEQKRGPNVGRRGFHTFSDQLREVKGPCWTCPLTLPDPIPTALHLLSAPEADAVGCIRQAPLPSGSCLGLASEGTRRKSGWEAGEVSTPVPSALPAGMRLDTNVFLYPRPQLPASGLLPTASGLFEFQGPLSPCPFAPRGTNVPTVAGPGALR